MGLKQVITEPGGGRKFNQSDEKYVIRLNDKKNGKIIGAESLKQITISEDIFSLLPTIKIEVEDQGAFFTSYNIKNGDTIYVTITPNIESEGNDPEPYVDSVFCVQSIDCIPMIDSNTFEYTIMGIFNAQNYLNEVSSYPKTSFESIYQTDMKRSDEAIHEVLDDTPLVFANRIDGSDNSLWINCRNTRSQFIDKIIDHAWISEDDAPLLYTDLNGKTYYSSVKTFANTKKLCNFINVKTYIDNLKTAIEDKEDLEYPFTSLEFLHAAGPILNQGGYKVKTNYYTPYNSLSLINSDITPKTDDIYSMLIDLVANGDLDYSAIMEAQLADGKTIGKFRESIYQQDEPYIAANSNKAASQMERLTRNVNIGMHFKDYHNHYDIAPIHNEMIRRSFFQNFVDMTVDTHRLPKEFKNNKARPVLGDKVNIDFSSSKTNIDNIHTGNYIVAGRVHHFKPFKSYTIEYKCVTDGTFGTGLLEEKEKED